MPKSLGLPEVAQPSRKLLIRPLVNILSISFAIEVLSGKKTLKKNEKHSKLELEVAAY